MGGIKIGTREPVLEKTQGFTKVAPELSKNGKAKKAKKVALTKDGEAKPKPKGKKRADIGFMMGATYIVVDTTLGGTFPKVFAASNARIPAFLANLAQGRKKKEYRHWKAKPPVEAFFVGIDHHGTISDDGIRLLHKVKRFAKLTKSYNGINTFWEHLSVGLVRGIAYGVDIMTHGEPPLGNEFALSAVV